MNEQQPRPHLNLNKDYLGKVENLIAGKGELEQLHFEYLQDVLAMLGVHEDVYAQYLAQGGEGHIKKIVEQTFVQVSAETISEDLFVGIQRLWDYLAESDPLERADLIFVFGGISQLAVEEAIRLKKENYAPKILFSGKKASYMKDVEMTEAERYKKLAIEAGVDEKDILIETDSINTPENVVKSAALLHSLNFLPEKIIAVSLPYHMKRASLTLRAGLDWNVSVIRHPGLSAKYSRETYFKDLNGWSYIFFEYLKLYGARQMGHF